MTDLPSTMRAVVLKHDGYSGTMTGPTITDASEWLVDAELPVPTHGHGLLSEAMAKADKAWRR